MPKISGHKWEICWDTHTFAESDVKEIATALNQVTNTTILLKPIGRYATLVDVLLTLSAYYVGISAVEFFKNCSAKIGEKIGDEIGNDIVKVYSKIKTLLIDKLTKNKSHKGFQFLYKIYINGFLISAVVHGMSDDSGIVGNSIDCVDQIIFLAASILSEFYENEELVELRIVFDNVTKQWKPLFIVTKQNVYEVESMPQISN